MTTDCQFRFTAFRRDTMVMIARAEAIIAEYGGQKLNGVMSWVPVGNDCSRRIGADWSRPAGVTAKRPKQAFRRPK